MEHPIPNPLMILPFGALLLLIALAPLCFADWWHHHYPKVALALGALTITYYLVGLHAPARVFEVGHEYFSFIALIGSLFVVAGGIHITVKGEATPMENVIFLLVGAIVANVVGTTGASMLLIRPWIRMNKYRITGHHIVFFIFIVSNLGGALTPIGDPPLFIGFLKGVPFFWITEHAWPLWLVALGFMLTIFFVVDYRNYLRAPKAVRATVAEPADTWRFEGGVNVLFLIVILAAVFIQRIPFLRELLMIGAAVGSYFLTRPQIHAANEFNFEPVKEVAILFIGIFATMLPALDWLNANAKTLVTTSPGFFYWAAGSLSAFLDNAPTYYTFLIAAAGVFITPETTEKLRQLNPGAEDIDRLKVLHMLTQPEMARAIVAISAGSVFFGAMTYIGNGPNFMVKSIAHHNKVHTPNFLRYLTHFGIPFLLPVLTIIWFIFFS
jgi:Na+/H+ antiporter NhaD/arsenite permease-like protein